MLKKLAACAIGGFTLGYLLGNMWLDPKKEIEYKHKTEYRTIVTSKPDGTRIVTKEKIVKKKEVHKAPAKPNWSIALRTDVLWKQAPNYGVTVGRRVLGDVWVEGSATTKGDATIGIRVEF